MKLLTVIKDGKYTGVQYEQDTPAIREHHAAQNEMLIFLDHTIEQGDIPTAAELVSGCIPPRIIDGVKISNQTRVELESATTIAGLRTVLTEILCGKTNHDAKEIL